MRAHVHHGTRETPARLADLGGGLWQARLEQPLLARAGDRVVVRSIAPPDTLGGGVVLDPAARRHGRRDDALARLERLRRGEPEPAPEPRRRRRRAPQAPPAPLPDSALALEERLRAAGHEPPNAADLEADDLAALRAAGRAVRVGRAMYAHPEALAAVRARVEAVVAAEGRDHAGAPARRASDLAQVRPGPPRAPRRRARDQAAARRLARPAPQIKKPGATPTTGR